MSDDAGLGEGLTCFIVGPIGDRLEPPGTEGRLRYENATQMWENVFEPACAVFGLAPVRADKISESGDIPEQIFTFLRDADVVIADLTGGNANVMYELGLRHTRDKITIQIGEHERLPFDVNTIRTVKFKRTEAGLIDARNSLIEALRAALNGSGTPVAATRIWNELSAGLSSEEVQQASALSFVSDDPADAVDDEGPGTLDLMVEGEAAMEALSGHLEDFSAQMTEMTAIGAESTPQIQEAQSFAAKLTGIRRFADQLQDPASRMDETSSEYLTGVEKVDKMMQLVLRQIREGELDRSGPDAEGVKVFIDGIKSMSASATEASVNFTEFVSTVREMRSWSNVLRPISKSLEHSINTILRGNAIVMGWGEQVEDLDLGDDGSNDGGTNGEADA